MFSFIRLSRGCIARTLLPVFRLPSASISTTPTLRDDYDDDEEDLRPEIIDIDIDKIMSDDPELARTLNYRGASGIQSSEDCFGSYDAPLVLMDLEEFENSNLQHFRAGLAIEQLKNDFSAENKSLDDMAPKPVEDDQHKGKRMTSDDDEKKEK